jgi:hypothetical protein
MVACRVQRAVRLLSLREMVIEASADDGADGGRAIRLYTPCDTAAGETCDWVDDIDGMTTRRWYPTLETLEDGSIIIIGARAWSILEWC